MNPFFSVDLKSSFAEMNAPREEKWERAFRASRLEDPTASDQHSRISRAVRN